MHSCMVLFYLMLGWSLNTTWSVLWLMYVRVVVTFFISPSTLGKCHLKTVNISTWKTFNWYLVISTWTQLILKQASGNSDQLFQCMLNESWKGVAEKPWNSWKLWKMKENLHNKIIIPKTQIIETLINIWLIFRSCHSEDDNRIFLNTLYFREARSYC